MIAKNLSEYLEQIIQLTISTNNVNWYRGHADKTWPLKPSLWRNFTRENERGMNHEFLWKAKSRTQNPPMDKDWPAWLSLMQHYRLPTRLLDWSKSPLVALYFAVEKIMLASKEVEPETDAAVWILSPGILNIYSGLEPYIFSIQTETAKEMIDPAFVNPKWVKENNKIIAVSAIEHDIRMMAQQSAFTIHSSMLGLEEFKSDNPFLYKIKIPKQHIRNISLELDIMGFKPSIIYPDLENLSTEIKTRYFKLKGL